jgi:hypothetical protein
MRAELRRWGRAQCPVCGLHLAHHARRSQRGPPPRYCSAKCRQKAYRLRHQPPPRQHARAKAEGYRRGWIKRYEKYGWSGGRPMKMGCPLPKPTRSKWAPEYPWYVVMNDAGRALALDMFATGNPWLIDKLAKYSPAGQTFILAWLRNEPNKVSWQAIEDLRMREQH